MAILIALGGLLALWPASARQARGAPAPAPGMSANQAAAADAALLKAARQLRAAIVKADAVQVMALVSRRHGLTCTDTTYGWRSVERQINDRSSLLRLSLFDAAGFAARCGRAYPADYPATSDRAFFLAQPEGPVDVSLEAGGGVARFRSSVHGLYDREYLFVREGGGWRVAGGMVLGRCACG